MESVRRRGWGGAARRRAAALAGALAVHATLFLFAFSSASGDLVSAAGAAGGQAGPVFEVSLVRIPHAAAKAGTDGVAAALLAAREQAGGLGDPIPVARTKASDDAFTAMERQLRAVQPFPPQTPRLADRERPESGSRHPSPAPLSMAEASVDGRNSSASGDSNAQTSTGSLWGAIEPCWRNLGIRGRVPVALEVALDATGGLRVPPRIVRGNTAPIDEPRLQAEAGALAAIAACAPRGNPMFGGRTYRLEFPAGP